VTREWRTANISNKVGKIIKSPNISISQTQEVIVRLMLLPSFFRLLKDYQYLILTALTTEQTWPLTFPVL